MEGVSILKHLLAQSVTRTVQQPVHGKVELGARYKCVLHGHIGVAVSEVRFLTGCNRVCLERLDKDGEVKEFWKDVTMVEKVEAEKVEPKQEDNPPGGPQPVPVRKTDCG